MSGNRKGSRFTVAVATVESPVLHGRAYDAVIHKNKASLTNSKKYVL